MNHEYTLNRLENLLYRARERRYYHDSRVAKLDSVSQYREGLKHWQKARDEEKAIAVLLKAIHIAKSDEYTLAMRLQVAFLDLTRHQQWDRDGCIWAGWYDLYAALGMNHDSFNPAFNLLKRIGLVVIAEHRIGLPADGLGYNLNRDFQQLMLVFKTDTECVIEMARRGMPE